MRRRCLIKNDSRQVKGENEIFNKEENWKVKNEKEMFNKGWDYAGL